MPRTVPAMATPVPSNFLTAALWVANVKALGDFTLGPPRFSGYQAAAQSVADNTWTSLAIDTEIIDSDAGHSTVTNTSRYTATVPGTYLVIGTTGWNSNTTGLRRARLALNGAPIIGTGSGASAPATSGVNGQIVASLVVMNGTTDYVEVQGNQTSGGALTTNPNTDISPSLRVLWVST